MLTISLADNNIGFDIGDNLTIADNTSFVRKDDISGKIEYVSVIFSDEENSNTNSVPNIFSSNLFLIILLVFLGILIGSIFYKNKKK